MINVGNSQNMGKLQYKWTAHIKIRQWQGQKIKMLWEHLKCYGNMIWEKKYQGLEKYMEYRNI